MSSVDEKGDVSNKDDETTNFEKKYSVSAEKTGEVQTVVLDEQREVELSENENVLLSTKSAVDDEGSNDTPDEELQLRWDDDDTELQEKPEPIDTMEVDEPKIEVSKAELIKTDHGLNKPNVMLNIPDFQMMDEQLEDFDVDRSSDIELNFEDSDNNLSELVTKVNANIAESLSAIDETELDSKLEPSPNVEDELLKDTDGEDQKDSESDIEIIPQVTSAEDIIRPDLIDAIDKEVIALTDTLEKLDDIPSTSKDTIDVSDSSPKVPQREKQQDVKLKVASLQGSIENAILLLEAEDSAPSFPELTEDEIMDVTTGIGTGKKDLDRTVSTLISEMDKEMELLDAQEQPPPISTELEVLEVTPTGNEKRKKEAHLKVSTIISSIEEEMKLLDSQEQPSGITEDDMFEETTTEAQPRQEEIISKAFSITSSEEVIVLDSQDKNEPEQENLTKEDVCIIEDNEHVEKQTTRKKKIEFKVSTIISDIEKDIELLDSQEEIQKSVADEKNDEIYEKKDVTIKVTDDSNDESKDEEKDESKQLKDFDEIAQAIKAIEKDSDPEDKPPQPTVVKVTEELSEFSIIDENDEPSISLIDDDNSIDEIVQSTEPVPISMDESEVSVIPDSDDEEPILVADETAELRKTSKVLTTQDSEVEVEMIFEKEDGTKSTAISELNEKEMKEIEETHPQFINKEELHQLSKMTPTETQPTLKVTNGKKISEEITIAEKTMDLQKAENNDECMSIDDDVPVEKDSKPQTENLPQKENFPQIDDPQPSTSTAELENKDSYDIQENSDSLGLLTESTRSMETIDDDEQDQDEQDQDEDDDDDEDFSHDDDGSNLMTAEHSDDSNSHPPSIDDQKSTKDNTPDTTQDVPVTTQKDVLNIQENSIDITMSCDASEKDTDTPDDKDEEFQFPAKSANEDQKESVQEMECDVQPEDSIKAPGETTEEKPTIQEPISAVKQSDIETVKLSDTSDTENDTAVVPEGSLADVIKDVIKVAMKDGTIDGQPAKKNLAFSSVQPILNFVDLEESSEDEPTDTPKPKEDVPSTTETPQPPNTVSEPQQPATEREQLEPEPDLIQPELLVDEAADVGMNVEVLDEEVLNDDDQPMETTDAVNSEVFNLDSDDEEKPAVTKDPKPTPTDAEPTERDFRCVNAACESDHNARCYVADASTRAFYNGGNRSRAFVCEPCLRRVETRNEELIEGIRNFTPLLELDMASFTVDLVEISDSDSDGEEDFDEHFKEKIGESGAKFVEENLEELLNETWKKIQMDTRLADTESVLQMEMKRIEKETKEIKSFLDACQESTDKIRNELYATFPQNIRSAPPLVIYDTPEHKYCYIQATQPSSLKQKEGEIPSPAKTRLSKRRMESTTATENPPKRPAIPLGYTPIDSDAVKTSELETKADIIEKIDDDDNMDVSVVNIIPQEAAPPGLPPAGELVRPPLKPGMTVYAMRNSFGSWMKAYVLEVLPRGTHSTNFTSCKVKFDSRNTKQTVLTARCLAYDQPSTTRMTIGTRVIALFKDKDSTMKRESYYSGIVAEVPNPVNSFRYLIFFDDGYAQYASHADTRLVCECSNLVWEEVHPFSREFVKQYLLAYPERPMVRLHPFQSLKTEWNGKWWVSRVVTVDASLAQVHFPVHGRYEWIYRGSTRLAPLYLELQAAERTRPRALPRTQAHSRSNMPVVEYTRYDEQSNKLSGSEKSDSPQHYRSIPTDSRRAVAKKSTSVVASVSQPASAPPRRPVGSELDNVSSRIVYYSPKNAVRPLKYVPHVCGPKCKRTDVLSLKELRTYNPLSKPLLCGWERQLVRFKGQKVVAYRAPCGRRVRDVRELHRYLRAVGADTPVDLFDFAPSTHCLAEFVLNHYNIMKKDLSQGKENVPVPCVNYYDDSLPEFCSYNTERTPTAGVPLNLDPEFLCGCDCEDDCEDKTKCACWKLTLEGARTIGLEGDNVGYVYKRLPEPLPSGIYECNSRCKCKHTCLNRVAQHPLQLKLQVFKTLNRGWGIRALNDIPKGAFLCVYAGNLLTDATANLDGLNEGDEYLAELDYIEVVEQMKEGYEEDIPAAIKKLDLQDKKIITKSDDEMSSSSEEESQAPSKNEREDDDFRPGYIGLGVAEFSKRLRRRKTKDKDNAEEKTDGEKEKEKEMEKEKEEQKKEEKGSNEEDCITISDDDEVREPSSFAAAAGMGANEFVSKYRSVRSLFGEDESCYIMDAKVQGNIGRYLNHSCSPNVFVQNVFVDTHDPRFPWVAFFALSHVRAGVELTWNYNYDVGSVPGKALYCYCGAPNCRGRLL